MGICSKCGERTRMGPFHKCSTAALQKRASASRPSGTRFSSVNQSSRNDDYVFPNVAVVPDYTPSDSFSGGGGDFGGGGSSGSWSDSSSSSSSDCGSSDSGSSCSSD